MASKIDEDKIVSPEHPFCVDPGICLPLKLLKGKEKKSIRHDTLEEVN